MSEPKDPIVEESLSIVSRRTILAGFIGAAASVALPSLSKTQTTDTRKRIYIAPDDHTDYMWTGSEEQYRVAFIDMIDYYVDLGARTAANPSDQRSRWNCDGSFWMWTYEKNKSKADFENRFIAGLRSGTLSSPLNTLVGLYGGAPAEAVLRGMYYAGRIERRYGLRFNLAVAMENQTLPYGLGALWAGAGAKYSWRGVCNCATQVPGAYDRKYEIYYWQGQDGSKILMKWQSLYKQLSLNPKYQSYYANLNEPYGGQAQDANENIGGYAEARYVFDAVDFVDADPNFKAKYPYQVIGVFGEGWDSLETKNSNFVAAAQLQSNSTRRVIVSNESDFFQDFEATYGGVLPSQSVTFGNEWELAISSLQEPSAAVRRATERLRAAEAMATLVSLRSPNYFYNANVNLGLTPGAASLPAGYGPLTSVDQRDIAFVNFGLYYEHDFGFAYQLPIEDRIAFNRRTSQNIVNYVEGLYSQASAGLGSLIPKLVSNERFFVFNQLGWSRSDFADYAYSGSGPVRAIDVSTGLEVPSQLVNIGGQQSLRILASAVPSVGYKVFEIQSGAPAAHPVAATINTALRTIENSLYKVTLADDGSIVSLIDKANGNRELAAQTLQNGRSKLARINDLGHNAGTNYASTVTAENVGAVSATLKIDCSGYDVPWDHTTSVTLYANSDRIDIRNEIHENITATTVWDYGFNLSQPDVWYEEVGAVIRAKLQSQGGHYANANARYDWQSLGHFVDISDATGYGATLSNWDCAFMKVGNSTVDHLDSTTPIVSPMAAGQESGSITNQAGDSYFLQRFSLRSHTRYDATSAMTFALQHQNPLATGRVTGNSSAKPLDAKSFSLLGVSAPAALLWAIKPAEEGISNGVIARFWNVSNADLNLKVTVNGFLRSASQTTHLETNLQTVNAFGNSFSVILGANAMRTYRAQFSIK